MADSLQTECVNILTDVIRQLVARGIQRLEHLLQMRLVLAIVHLPLDLVGVGDTLVIMPTLYWWQVRDCIPACQGSPRCPCPSAGGAELPPIHLNLHEVRSLETMLWLRIDWQDFARSCSQYYQPSSCPTTIKCQFKGQNMTCIHLLSNSIVPCLENIESHLVAHLDQGGNDELQHHPILVSHQVSNVFQNVVLWPVEVTVAEVCWYETVLKLGIFPFFVDVEEAESLAWRTTDQYVYLTLLWHSRPSLSCHGLGKQSIALGIEDLTVRIILLECLS